MHTPSTCPDRPAIATPGRAGETGGIDFPVLLWIGFALSVLGMLLDALAIGHRACFVCLTWLNQRSAWAVYVSPRIDITDRVIKSLDDAEAGK